MFQKLSKTDGWNENFLDETVGDYLGVKLNSLHHLFIEKNECKAQFI